MEAVALTHPDAARLVEAVQEEYVARYGGRDETPLDPGEFAAGRGMFLVLYDGDRPAATGAWRWHADVAGVEQGSCAEIKRMYVAPAHRRRGHARRMLAELEQRASAAGARTMILETGLRQPEAITLYESAGYLPIPGFGHYRDAPLSRCYARVLSFAG